MLLPSGNPFKCHEEVLYLQAMILPTGKRFDISPPDWGMLRRSRRVQIFLETVRKKVHCCCRLFNVELAWLSYPSHDDMFNDIRV